MQLLFFCPFSWSLCRIAQVKLNPKFVTTLLIYLKNFLESLHFRAFPKFHWILSNAWHKIKHSRIDIQNHISVVQRQNCLYTKYTCRKLIDVKFVNNIYEHKLSWNENDTFIQIFLFFSQIASAWVAVVFRKKNRSKIFENEKDTCVISFFSWCVPFDYLWKLP